MALKADEVYAILDKKIRRVSEQIGAKGTAVIYRGSVATEELLPVNPEVGDMYNIESESSYGGTGMNVAWTGDKWDSMGETIDLSTLKLPNPYVLRFSGAVSAEYDGSSEIEVKIPQGSGATVVVSDHIVQIN